VEKFKVRNFRRSPELPKNVRNFQRKSGTSEEGPELPKIFQEISVDLRI